MSALMVDVISAGLTDTGMVREANEDSLYVDDRLKLYIVADGMGGHLAGEVASDMVVKGLRDSMLFFQQGSADANLFAADDTLSQEANMLCASIIKANDAVYRESRSKKNCRGMGSTVSSVFFAGTNIIAANVGDSPIFLVRNGEIELLSVIHTVEAEQLAASPEKLGSIDKKYHHMLTRAIGVSGETVPDVCELPCFNEDRLILCSDGLSNMVSPSEMVDVVSANSPEASCRTFIDLANSRGGDDNITVIVLRIVTEKKGFFLKQLLIDGCQCAEKIFEKIKKYKREVLKRWQRLR